MNIHYEEINDETKIRLVLNLEVNNNLGVISLIFDKELYERKSDEILDIILKDKLNKSFNYLLDSEVGSEGIKEHGYANTFQIIEENDNLKLSSYDGFLLDISK